MSLRNPSPLRYPGGKVSLAGAFESIIYANGLQGCTYVEPFAGGAGAGIKLLQDGHIARLVINDADRAVYCFWNSVMRHRDEMLRRIEKTPLTVDEWRNQREVYLKPGRRKIVDIGFAAFYLNRCNRSGIIKNGGPIGGIEQKGKWKIDARFNREELAERVDRLAGYGDRVVVLREDANDLLRNVTTYVEDSRLFVYIDPPYYVKGRELYLNHFEDGDHASLAKLLKKEKELPWVMTYDDVPRIRELYRGLRVTAFNLRYSAHNRSELGGEALISPSHMTIPPAAKRHLRTRVSP